MEQEGTASRLQQQIARHTAEHPFPQAVMPIGPGNQNPGPLLRGDGLQTDFVGTHTFYRLERRRYAVAPQPGGDIV